MKGSFGINPLYKNVNQATRRSASDNQNDINDIVSGIKNKGYKNFFKKHFIDCLPLTPEFKIDTFLTLLDDGLTRGFLTNVKNEDLEKILLSIEEAHKIYKKANPNIGITSSNEPKSSSLKKFDLIIKKSKSIILYIIATKLILEIGLIDTSDSNPLYQSLSKLCDSIYDSTSPKESAQPLNLNQNKEKAESREILQTLETLNSHTDESLKKFFSFAESSQIGKLEKSIQALSDLFKNNIRGEGKEVKLFKEILLKISNQKGKVLKAEEGQLSHIYRFDSGPASHSRDNVNFLASGSPRYRSRSFYQIHRNTSSPIQQQRLPQTLNTSPYINFSGVYLSSDESNSFTTHSFASDSLTSNSANNTSISAQEGTATDFYTPHPDNSVSPDTYVLGESNSRPVNYSLYDSGDSSRFLYNNHSSPRNNRNNRATHLSSPSDESNSPVVNYSYFDPGNHSELECNNNPISRTTYLSPVFNQNSSPRYYPDLSSNKIFTDQQEPTSVKSVYDVLKETNKNSETIENNQNSSDTNKNSETIKNNRNSSWYNNKKLLKALKKVAGCDFDALKKALNSSENRENSLIKDLGLTSGDLSVLDVIDELRDTKRASDSFAAKNSERTNLKEFLSLIPEADRNKFFAFDKDKDVELRIIQPDNDPRNARARKLEKTILTRT
jgi:hypothetical protein